MESTFELLKQSLRKEALEARAKRKAEQMKPKLCKYPNIPRGRRDRSPIKRLPGQVHKRCPNCNTHLFLFQTDTSHDCWKCGKKLKIIQALRCSTYHPHGIILRVVDEE
jgi:predicted RNA-binding Zn-ribbon protein involved in translation (DUF1610 family)